MADLEKIAEDLSALTVLEAAELATLLEEKWGVSAAAPVAVAAVAGGDAGGAAAAEEKDEFDVILAEAGGKKIEVIKLVPQIAKEIKHGIYKYNDANVVFMKRAISKVPYFQYLQEDEPFLYDIIYAFSTEKKQNGEVL